MQECALHEYFKMMQPLQYADLFPVTVHTNNNSCQGGKQQT